MTKAVKNSYIFLIGSVLSMIMHNFIAAIFHFEDAIFFLLTFILFLAFIISIIYNLVTYILKRQPKDIWQLGWLGLFSFFFFGIGFCQAGFGFLILFLFFLFKLIKIENNK